VSEPDLFVICKNCSSEVSPYVTECPYCGQRVRKRAPRIEPSGEPRRRSTRRPPSLSRLRGGEIPGIAPETRPSATFALIGLSLLATVVAVTTILAPGQDESLLKLGGIYGPLESDWWRLATSPFLHNNIGYQFIALVATGLFGTHLERRFGWLAPVVVFLAAGAAGAALSVAAGEYPALGANGAALGLLCAWLVDDRRANRRGWDREADLLGVYVVAAVLALLSLAWPDASYAAAAGGALAGALLGLVLPALRTRSFRR